MELGKGYISDIVTFLSYDANLNVEYIGKAAAGSAAADEVWSITKLIYDVNQNVTQVLYADGNKKFDKIWDSRATYSYS
jgi:hypothetical protein